MLTPISRKLNIPAINNKIKLLPAVGKICLSPQNLCYLNINNDYIHQNFLYLNIPAIQKPDYFGPTGIGAHISVIYPNENKALNLIFLGQEYDFTVYDLVEAEIHLKKYYILLVESLALIQLRKKHGLQDKLNFKNYSIGFHITIGVTANSHQI